jgi:hypothetical protein
MTTMQLQNQAYSEWSRSPAIKCNYHTFEYYWMERYARVYQLPVRISPAGLSAKAAAIRLKSLAS